MNRKKKINQIYNARMKKQNAKLHKSNKPRYISKADRAKMEAEQALEAQALENLPQAESVESQTDAQSDSQ
ncbi:DUF2986 domain-containing protein [Vibrio navarrensis]|jgi:hypothetical protein|uniref:DUF2986 domain-containing protein n=1 Tax=Vibrio navarrensis TaxID=29495 RepID=A0AAI9CTG8_9VIBR|nr:DUF2986 domain-containing protein [Vibrio navarrensis]EJL6399279.1 DUF2986 domain-containing protein [Vibrio navarrensis]EJL6565553.1 DUF2986 domain-containing protein [Vibrio navarrensis]ELN6932112.1 DUF2986 domain-containing protein [Vibrio navarrensis]KGK14765.1 hypothetical protein EA24_11160 [Vibrio navarrensis]MBH9739216.1 DUF2986 domain-containing protein [Vibrio navarrensis]